MADNTVTIVGNITRDPELRFTAGGKGIASFGLAVNRRYQQNGEWQEKVSFFNVTAWDQLGENAAASLTKGTRVMVSGRLQTRSWETDQGEKRSKVEVLADEVGGQSDDGSGHASTLSAARRPDDHAMRNRPDCDRNASGFPKLTFATAASAWPRSRISARALGTASGSLRPQSPAELIQSLSVP